jgi:hypothetical protein
MLAMTDAGRPGPAVRSRPRQEEGSGSVVEASITREEELSLSMSMMEAVLSMLVVWEEEVVVTWGWL